MHDDTMTRAWEIYDDLLSHARFVYEEEPDGLEKMWRALCSQPIIAPNLWTDGYLAAFAAAGKMQFVTFDRGFRQFPGLDVVVRGQPIVHEAAGEYAVA
jgi:predicted nucleic acid-binding protein